MARRRIYIPCPYNGDCDKCTLPDCYADPAEILDFYSRENAEAKRKWGKKLDNVIPFERIDKEETG